MPVWESPRRSKVWQTRTTNDYGKSSEEQAVDSLIAIASEPSAAETVESPKN